MKQSNPQYSNTGDSSTDKSRKSKPVGFRYKNVDKDSKLYYKTPSDSLIRKFEKGDESAREKIYFEKRQDHSDKNLSGRTFAEGGGIGDKDKYIKIYNDRLDRADDEAKKEGIQIHDYIDFIGDDLKSDEIVGHYLMYYGDDSLKQWLENTEGKVLNSQDLEVTEKLKELFSNNKLAKGGGVNKIKDIDINSVTKIPNEVYFKGKRYIGKAGFINGFNGYESSKDDGMLCAYTQEEGYDKEKLSLWNNNSKPNYITDKDGSKIMSKNYRGNSITFEENGVRKFNEGGGVSALEYSEIYEVLKDKIESVVEDIDFENSSSFKGEEVEHKSRDGFWAYTDGGFEAVWFEYNSQLEGSGNKLPTKPLQTEMQRQISYGYELAKEEFVKKYPEIVEELGEDNIDYHTLQESGYEDEAEELSEMERESDGEDTVQMKVLAYYYNPENSKGKDGKHTISLQADVNLESPYHRSGNLDDGKEIIFTFDSMDELSEKMDSGLQEILAWFNGSDYNTSTTEMKVRRMAKGGGMKRNIAQDKNIKALHAGKRTSADGNIYYENRANRSDLNRTKRFGEGGGFVDLHKKEASFLKDKGYDIGNGDYVLFNTLDGEEGIEAVQGNKGIIPNIEYAVAYFIDDNSDVLLVTKKLLRKIKKDFGMGYTLYTNAGVEIHHTELHKGKFEDIKIVRVPYDEMIKFKVGGGVRSSNKNSRSLVLARTPFNANNLSGELVGDVFVVKSYGYYPVFVYKDGKWYENDNKYSPSTAKQMTQARPTSDAELLNVEELKALYSFEDGGSMGTSELKSIENSIENYLSMNQEVGVDMLTIYLGRKPNYEENVVGYKIRKKLLSPYFKRVS